MAQLIRMRQRIKAIKTIKKITHALRLISMSTHLRLRTKKNSVEFYKATLEQLFNQLQKLSSSHNHWLMQKNELSSKPLIILVGSQKGLCGNFNSELFAFYEKETPPELKHTATFIAIGKKAHDFVRETNHPIALFFDNFSMANLEKICLSITNYLLEHHKEYSQVTIYSSYSKSFFTQQSHTTSLIPFCMPKQSEEMESTSLEDYIWEQKPEEILDFLIKKLFYITIYEALFQSLIAEQAARFIAMDNSTRSASKLLDSMQLMYNKMRQSKITGELTDLIGGFF